MIGKLHDRTQILTKNRAGSIRSIVFCHDFVLVIGCLTLRSPASAYGRMGASRVERLVGCVFVLAIPVRHQDSVNEKPESVDDSARVLVAPAAVTGGPLGTRVDISTRPRVLNRVASTATPSTKNPSRSTAQSKPA